MKMKKTYILASALLCCGLSASAQNLNPTVEVTRPYEGKLLETRKPYQKMAVPDSVLKFDMAFDYSVFSNPYKGGFDFKPYLVELRPEADSDRSRNLSLRLGAGYTLHPVFDVVWSPEIRGPFQMDLYASHHSYFGQYWNVFASRKDEDASWYRLVAEPQKHLEANPFGDDLSRSGYDSDTRAGVNGRYDWETGSASFDLGYRGIHTGDANLGNSGWNGLYLSTRAASNKTGEDYFFYDAAIDYRYSVDDLAWMGNKVYSHDFMVRGTFGPVITGKNRVMADVFVGISTYGGWFKSNVGNMYVTPKYIFTTGPFQMSLGAKISIPVDAKGVFVYDSSVAPADPEYAGYSVNPSRDKQFIYPDVHITYDVIDEYMNAYLRVTGGDDFHTYSSLKERNHFFTPRYGRETGPFSENSKERINAALGIRGNIASRFRYQWDVVGYVWHYKGLLDAVRYTGLDAGRPLGLLPAVCFEDYSRVYSSLAFAWDSQPLLVDGRLDYNWTSLFAKGRQPLGFAPASFSGEFRARYNWNGRIFAGVSGEFSTARRGYASAVPSATLPDLAAVRLPGWFDLGLEAEFAFTRKISFWLKAGNLLFQPIQRTPLYAERGASVTAGIALNL